MVWVNEVDSAKSLADLTTSKSIIGDAGDDEVLDSHKSNGDFKRKVSIVEAAPKNEEIPQHADRSRGSVSSARRRVCPGSLRNTKKLLQPDDEVLKETVMQGNEDKIFTSESRWSRNHAKNGKRMAIAVPGEESCDTLLLS